MKGCPAAKDRILGAGCPVRPETALKDKLLIMRADKKRPGTVAALSDRVPSFGAHSFWMGWTGLNY